MGLRCTFTYCEENNTNESNSEEWSIPRGIHGVRRDHGIRLDTMASVLVGHMATFWR